MRILACMIALLIPVFTVAAQNVDLGTDEQREAGRVVYEAKCAHCHGSDGVPRPTVASVFRPAPRNFTTGTFKFRTTASGELPTDEDIRKSIRNGMPYTAMPPWPSLSNADVTNLMYHIKTFSSDFSGPFGEVTALEMPSPHSMTDESIARGREVYETNQCSDCHGNRGLGDGPSAPTLEDRWGYPIRAADMTKRWTFRGGGTREDIYQTFTTGLDGSPMPSFEISPTEDQWALVDYVYSLSLDEPNYATMVTAHATTRTMDLSQESFADIEPAYFPVVGQIIEPGRAFFPGVNGVDVRAVYNDEYISIMLQWHDMAAETSGSNAPDLIAPGALDADSDSTLVFSDAVAIQFPTVLSAGTEMPYFIFGDRKLSTDIWFADLAGSGARHYVGKGASNMSEEGPELDVSASFQEGEWTVIFRRARNEEAHIAFEEGTFVPIAFSIWDGFSRERGNKRGLTSWAYLYMDVAVKESPVLPMMAYGFATLLLGLVVTFVTRKKVHGARASSDDKSGEEA